jgi:hypothetical protein
MTEESLKRELARLRKERTALSKQAVQDARFFKRINTIGWKTKNVLNQLTEHFPGWKDDEDRIPHRDTDGQINTVRYEAVNLLLANRKRPPRSSRKEWKSSHNLERAGIANPEGKRPARTEGNRLA